MESFANLVGTGGVLSLLVAYFMAQRGTLTVNDIRYLWMNLGGAIAILFSLIWEWNFPAFLIEAAWAGISAYSIMKLKQNKE